MKIVVIERGGLSGARLIADLRNLGHEVISASAPSVAGAITGDGLAEVLRGAQVVVEVTIKGTMRFQSWFSLRNPGEYPDY